MESKRIDGESFFGEIMKLAYKTNSHGTRFLFLMPFIGKNNA